MPTSPRRQRNLETNLVSHDEIATRLGVEVATVHKWKQRYSDFPDPFVKLKIGPVYWWPDVQEWHGTARPASPKPPPSSASSR